MVNLFYWPNRLHLNAHRLFQLNNIFVEFIKHDLMFLESMEFDNLQKSLVLAVLCFIKWLTMFFYFCTLQVIDKFQELALNIMVFGVEIEVLENRIHYHIFSELEETFFEWFSDLEFIYYVHLIVYHDLLIEIVEISFLIFHIFHLI